MKRQRRPADILELTQLEVDCILGELAHERVTPQRISVAVRLTLDAERAAHSCNLADTVDYARVEQDLRFVLEHAHFHLVESAALAMVSLLLGPPFGSEPAPVRGRVTVRKPAALPSGALPSLTVERAVSHMAPRAMLPSPSGTRQTVLFACADVMLMQLSGDPALIPAPSGYAVCHDRRRSPTNTLRVARPK